MRKQSENSEALMMHPKHLAKTRTKEAMANLNRLLLTNLTDFGSPLKLNWKCPLAEHHHLKSFRQFAHTLDLDYDDRTVCVTAEIGQLPDEFLYGILAHEFGHIIAVEIWDDDTEEGADRAVDVFLELDIRYGTPWELEFVDFQDVEKLNNI